MRIAGKLGPFAHELCGSVAQNEEDIEAARAFAGMKYAFFAGEIEAAPRLMEEQPPAFRAEQKRNGDARAVGPQVVSPLPVSHVVFCAAAVQRMHALAEAEYRPFPIPEADASCAVETQLLPEFAVLVFYRDAERIGQNMNAPPAPRGCRHGLCCMGLQQRLRP